MGNQCYSINEKDKFSNRKSKILEEVPINKNVLVDRSEGTPLMKYMVLQPLGEGSYGKVFLVRHKETGIKRAMKEIKKNINPKPNQSDDQEVLNEIEILKKLDHPNILKIYEFFAMSDRYYLITEYCTEGELFNKITQFAPFEENKAAYIMHQIISAVYYCHNNNIIHRDLKPENILISSQGKERTYEIKIIDFGTAKIFRPDEIENKITGSSYYIAPEVLTKKYNEKCDLWSCGVILYILLSGKAPFSGENDTQIMARVLLGKYDLSNDMWNIISDEAKSLVKQLLVYKPEDRISAKETLNHAFFTKYKLNNPFVISKENILSYIENLKNYRPEYFLQQAALALIVHNIPDNEEIKELTKLFKLLDENGDGKITKEELRTGLKKLVNEESNEKSSVDEIFFIVDTDRSGFIDFQEFLRACVNKEKLLTEGNLKFAFHYFDRDSSGEITTQELKQVFFKNNKKCKEEVLKELIEEVDQNKDGQISFEEFKTMMNTIFFKHEEIKKEVIGDI
jgi:calcium-dependent protein kinase